MFLFTKTPQSWHVSFFSLESARFPFDMADFSITQNGGGKHSPLKSRPTKDVPPRNCQCYQEQLHGSAHLECSMQAALARNSR